MTATLWLDTAADRTLELGPTLQLYQSFAEMARAAGPTCYQDYPDLFGVISQVEDQEDAQPDWLADIRSQAVQFLDHFGQQLGDQARDLLHTLANAGSEGQS